MSKKTAKAKDFLTRSASHSLTGYASGYCKILPHNALDSLQTEDIRNQRERIKAELTTLRETKRTRRLTKSERKRWNKLKGILGNLEKTINVSTDEYEEKKAWIFWRLAGCQLKHEIYKELDLQAERILAAKILAEQEDK